MRTKNSPKVHRQCRGKVRHETKEAGAIAAIRSREEYADVTLNSYLCGVCKGWHVGHPPKRIQRLIGPMRLVQLIEKAVRD